MQNWAVHIKYATARGAPAVFDAVIRAIGAEAARDEAIRRLARRRKGFTVKTTVTREIRECAA